MAIQNQPTGDRRFVEFIRYWRPHGSQTVLWVQEMKTQRMCHMLRWGNEIYLPIDDGDHLGIGLHNGRNAWAAFPAYIEARNLWDGGQSEPEDCDTDHMWELQPWQNMVMDALMNPGRQRGRPLIIVESGSGLGIGEATFGTTQYHGQIRVYERLSLGGGFQNVRPTNAGAGTRGGVTMGFESGPAGLESFSSVRGSSSHTKGPAAIGAGEEEVRHHRDTGVAYQRNAQPVVFLRAEYRSDLQGILPQAWGSSWDWFWPIPDSTNWWDEPWSWRPDTGPTAPQIPLARRPHSGRR